MPDFLRSAQRCFMRREIFARLAAVMPLRRRFRGAEALDARLPFRRAAPPSRTAMASFRRSRSALSSLTILSRSKGIPFSVDAVGGEYSKTAKVFSLNDAVHLRPSPECFLGSLEDLADDFLCLWFIYRALRHNSASVARAL